MLKTLLTPALLALLAAPAVAFAQSDEEDEDKPVTPATPSRPTPAPAAPGAPVASPPAAAGAGAGVAQSTPEEQKLVSGAPLYNPNVAVHILEEKEYSDAMKREVVLYPLVPQVNGRFTQHYGTYGAFIWHLQENFGLQLFGGGNWLSFESGFNEELVEKGRVKAQSASSLLQVWTAMAGVEVTPFYGKFALFEGVLLKFSLVLSGGAGLGGTRHQLAPFARPAGPSWGDTGIRFMGQIAAGFRVQIGERFALRLEVRDILYSALVDRINGCNEQDIGDMLTEAQQMRPITSVQVGAGCRPQAFGNGSDPTTVGSDLIFANNLVRPTSGVPSSDVLSNVGLYLGASFLF